MSVRSLKKETQYLVSKFQVKVSVEQPAAVTVSQCKLCYELIVRLC